MALWGQIGLPHARYVIIIACPSVRKDNPRALAFGLSPVPVGKYAIIILYHIVSAYQSGKYGTIREWNQASTVRKAHYA